MEEMWYQIPQFPTYMASNLGRIKNFYTGRILKQQKHESYLRVTLRKDGRSITRGVHQLVASAIWGYQPGMQVNHKDGNKNDNSQENLEWATPRENSQHAWSSGLSKGRGTRRVKINETGQEFDSLTACAKAIGGYPGNISSVLSGRAKRYKGYTFTYL